jgi:predicted Zn-dependent peptidase
MTLTYDTAVLPNGLRVIHAPSPTNVVYCGYAINAGTRDEADTESGMAHFCEHTIFKGTTHRSSIDILNRMEVVGGEINAYTAKEETMVYAAFLKEHFARAVDLLTDIVFCSTFPQAEIDKEKEVIIDEIQSYQDTPSELIFDEFEQLIFPNHPLGRDILGDPERLRAYSSSDPLRFTSRFYRPENMAFFIFGDIDFKKILHELQRAIEKAALRDGLPLDATPTSSTVMLGKGRMAPEPCDSRSVTTHKDTHQTHVMIGGRAYNAYDEKHIGLYLLNNLLGGPGMNARLNIALREKRGLVYTVESNQTSYTDAGIFCIYFGCDDQDSDRCIHLVHRELDQLMKKPLSDAALRAAKRQIIGQIGVACDHFESYALGIGKEFLHYNRPKDIPRLCARLNSFTSAQLQDIANEIFAESNLSTLIYK